MDITKQTVNVNPRENANPLSVLFFTYTAGMFKKGYSKTLDVDDLYNPITSDQSAILGNRLEAKWKKHLEKMKKLEKTPSFLKVLVQTFWPEYLYLGILLIFLDIILRLLSPLMLGELLDYFRSESTKTKDQALLYAGAVVAINAANAVLINQYVMNAFHYGMKVRAACCALIYRKALRLSKTALGETASGKVVNLLSNDVSRFDVVSIFIHHMWIAPTTSLIVTYFLWTEASYAGLIGMIPVFLIAPLQSYTGKLSSVYRRQTAYKTDERVRLMDEIIAGVQVIKMYAWEKPFEKIIKLARKLELKIITKLSYVRGLFMTFNLFTTRVSLFCSLLTMVLMGQEITAPKVFVFMTYFNILSQIMSSMFVRGISEVAEAIVAVKRLQEFLVNDEFVERVQLKNNNESKGNYGDGMIVLDNLSSKWSPNSQENALNNINIIVNKGTLLGVIGSVGSGKSSLLQTILGELDISGGNIEINGSVSYASQEPWVFSATVRQNIIFGKSYNKDRYDEVVRVCNLEKDFKQFNDGDLTIVGDRGASLSGGQKARINLARAVYHDTDIYLLDDPLSAVDTHVGKHLYEQCINGFLANKTRILVTHQVHHLKNAENIIILNNGHVQIQGKYNDLAASDNTYAKLLTSEPEEDEKKGEGPTKLIRQISSRNRSSSMTSTRSESSIIESLLQEEDDENEVKVKEMQEESSKGKVKGSLFLNYLLAGGNVIIVGIVLLLYVLTQMSASAVDYFVSYWVKVEELRTEYAIVHNNTLAEEFPEPGMNTFLYIYGGLIIMLFFIALTRSMTFYKLAMISSKNLHNAMFISVIKATMRFFDTNPSGRILNRFSKDIGTIDELLPKVILDAGQIILLMFGSIILVAVVNPYFLIPTGVIACFFLLCRMVFLKSSKNIKRLEGITRSPVFTHLNASLQGLTTIRAYGAQDILISEFDKHQDLHTSAWYMYIAASSAFGFSLDILCFIYTGLVTFSFLMIGEKTAGGDVGLAISQATALTGLVQWGMRQAAEVSNQLMSVERVLEYASLPSEKQPITPKTPKKDEWPTNGKISFQNMGLRYADGTELVLKNLNITIHPKEKIGIVGRTGAGKSSLIAALFRLAIIEGEIEIDGIYTKDLLLQDLRSKISIIPQDPVLFSGTLRYNLDPFGEYPDEVLYKALKEVELKDPSNIINRLENHVMDGGSNYSVGQRQLVCLARAIIRNNKILMLDEATANVDPQTDAVIQKTIREKFADCTVLTVAHRLNTIMDSDRVLVMDSGTMVEFNHPHLLMQNHKGVFYKMVAETGKHITEQLKKIARQNYEEKHGVPE
ncbi:hypothetical protein RN001_008242 [Aquatica leii]|uniref:Uncharacterized protein n=1 Tax=Aquatica leii TaxID=1421715 RepID=A0AAN7S9J4_9COLE|nr:hypothetical protein RN001_008242 [Aquatica leii]